MNACLAMLTDDDESDTVTSARASNLLILT